ncbi:hypothetical protein AAZX31_17G197600 [Glycine max]
MVAIFSSSLFVSSPIPESIKLHNFSGLAPRSFRIKRKK